MATVTQESVYAAASAIKNEGGRASVPAVTAHLGGGSPNVITKLSRQRKEGNSLVGLAEIAIDPRIAAAISEQIARSISAATSDLNAKLSDAHQDIDLLAQAGQEAELRSIAIQHELNDARNLLHERDGQIMELQSLVAELHILKKVAMDAEKQAAVAVAMAESADARAMAAELRETAAIARLSELEKTLLSRLEK